MIQALPLPQLSGVIRRLENSRTCERMLVIKQGISCLFHVQGYNEVGASVRIGRRIVNPIIRILMYIE